MNIAKKWFLDSFFFFIITKMYIYPTKNKKKRNYDRLKNFEKILIFERNYLKKLSHLISSQSLNLGGRRGTTNYVAIIPFHPSLSSAALRESPNPILAHSLMISSHLFCLSLLLAPFTVHGRTVFPTPEDLEM